MQQLLAWHQDRKVRVLVVWEPILITDWRPPGSAALGRIPDGRVRQFWDPKHLVAEELTRITNQQSPQLKPDCCMKKGFHWDEGVLYGLHSNWKDAPTPVFWNGPVFRVVPALEKAWRVIR